MKEFIDKLISRLEERKQKTRDLHGKPHMDYGTLCGIERGIDIAIEIVNQLAEEYNNDFCEWFKYDYRTIAPKYHDAENPYWRIPENLDKLKYCPYCGKKIKVVE